MTFKTLFTVAAVAVGTLGIADRADAQWRRNGGVYLNPTYGYTYNPGAVYSSGYSYPAFYPNTVVYPNTIVTAGYNSFGTVYSGTNYVNPFNSGYYNSPYSYSNRSLNGYGVGVNRGYYGRGWRW